MQDNLENTVQDAAETPKTDPNENNVMVLKPFLQCRFCPRKYKIMGALRNHEDSCPQNTEVLLKSFTCTECDKSFSSAKSLQKHGATHKTDSFKCNLCKASFATPEEKTLHKASKHASKNMKNKCKVCPDVTFSSEDEYLYHIIETHKGQFGDYYICSECGKQLKTRSELLHHINSKCGTIKLHHCSVCGQSLMTAGSLYNHMLRHTGKRSHMCGYCGKLFLTTGQLKVHERIHTQEKAFVCNICNKGFCHRQSLITHSSLHTGVKPYQCDGCGHSFSCVGNLIKHRRTHANTCGSIPLTTHTVNHPATKMKVKLNTPKTSKLKVMQKEQEIKEKLAAYKEKIQNSNKENTSEQVEQFNFSSCEYDEKSKVQEEIKLSEALEEDAAESQSKVLSSNKENTSVQVELNKFNFTSCEYDDKSKVQEKIKLSEALEEVVAESQSKVLTDVRLNLPAVDIDSTIAFEDINSSTDEIERTEEPHEDAENYTEDNVQTSDEEEDLKAVITQSVELKIRVSSKKASKKRKRKPDGRFCKFCNKYYANNRWLLKHEREHENLPERNDKATFKCSCCKAAFETREECKTHQQDAHADILTCQECDKLFSNLDSLRSHQNIFHKGVPRKVYIYVCEKCGLQFRQKASLMHHENSNCGPGPSFECQTCSKSFTSLHTRQSHMRIHDPKKWFLCKFCGKNFRWKGQLKIHERSHTGEKPFACLYCPKAFAYRESLITHSSLHTGIKPHLCQACGSRFSCIGNLIKHRATHASTCGVWYSKNQS